MSANDRQVGGNHYKCIGEEHWDRAWRLGMNYWQAAATKYIERYQYKNGKEDLLKAIHYIEKLIELEYGGESTAPAPEVEPPWKFSTEITRFHVMFDLPRPATPTLYADEGGPAARLNRFTQILLDEVSEAYEIIDMLKHEDKVLEAMTALADWLGDIQVYAASEMRRWGIPHEQTLKIIMDSQASKLVDGKPVVKDGKVQKGPNYTAPEPALKKMLSSAMGWHYTPLTSAKVFTGHGPVNIPLAHPIDPVTVAAHEDEVWQCEGFYGNGTQLYRHRKERTLVLAGSLGEARAAYALWSGQRTQAPATPANPV